ncbi:MAG: hypothetical protein BWK79_05310 [Beggiatoa sp. IS2]|nr:MAG: hypothetical protein BWK79_05310 [Beggiatoa sp. IS2]
MTDNYGDRGEFTKDEKIQMLSNGIDRLSKEKEELTRKINELIPKIMAVEYWCDSYYQMTVKKVPSIPPFPMNGHKTLNPNISSLEERMKETDEWQKTVGKRIASFLLTR